MTGSCTEREEVERERTLVDDRLPLGVEKLRRRRDFAGSEVHADEGEVEGLGTAGRWERDEEVGGWRRRRGRVGEGRGCEEEKLHLEVLRRRRTGIKRRKKKEKQESASRKWSR